MCYTEVTLQAFSAKEPVLVMCQWQINLFTTIYNFLYVNVYVSELTFNSSFICSWFRFKLVGNRENFCQQNQTWQHPHPICQSKCLHIIVMQREGEQARGGGVRAGRWCPASFIIQSAATHCACKLMMAGEAALCPRYCAATWGSQLATALLLGGSQCEACTVHQSSLPFHFPPCQEFPALHLLKWTMVIWWLFSDKSMKWARISITSARRHSYWMGPTGWTANQMAPGVRFLFVEVSQQWGCRMEASKSILLSESLLCSKMSVALMFSPVHSPSTAKSGDTGRAEALALWDSRRLCPAWGKRHLLLQTPRETVHLHCCAVLLWWWTTRTRLLPWWVGHNNG